MEPYRRPSVKVQRRSGLPLLESIKRFRDVLRECSMHDSVSSIAFDPVDKRTMYVDLIDGTTHNAIDRLVARGRKIPDMFVDYVVSLPSRDARFLYDRCKASVPSDLVFANGGVASMVGLIETIHGRVLETIRPFDDGKVVFVFMDEMSAVSVRYSLQVSRRALEAAMQVRRDPEPEPTVDELFELLMGYPSACS